METEMERHWIRGRYESAGRIRYGLWSLALFLIVSNLAWSLNINRRDSLTKSVATFVWRMVPPVRVIPATKKRAHLSSWVSYWERTEDWMRALILSLAYHSVSLSISTCQHLHQLQANIIFREICQDENDSLVTTYLFPLTSRGKKVCTFLT